MPDTEMFYGRGGVRFCLIGSLRRPSFSFIWVKTCL